MSEIKEFKLFKLIMKLYCNSYSSYGRMVTKTTLYDNLIETNKFKFYYSEELYNFYRSAKRVSDLPGSKIIININNDYEDGNYHLYNIDYLPNMLSNRVKTGWIAKHIDTGIFGKQHDTPEKAINSTRIIIKHRVVKSLGIKK